MRGLFPSGIHRQRSAAGDLAAGDAAVDDKFGAGDGAHLAHRNGHLWWGEEPLLRIDQIALPGEQADRFVGANHRLAPPFGLAGGAQRRRGATGVVVHGTGLTLGTCLGS